MTLLNLSRITNDGLIISRRLLKLSIRYSFLFLLLPSISVHAAAETAADDAFYKVTSAAYRDIGQNQKIGIAIADLGKIIKAAETAKSTNDSVTAITSITRNLSGISKQIHLPEIQKIANIGLSLHNLAIATDLLRVAQDQGDIYSEARITFELAKYHADQGRWTEALKLLKNPGIIESLTKENAAEANLLIGSSLQRQKKHRDAMPFYEKITSDSPHYRLAQLNLATANIRQDWWSDAQLAIQNALKINHKKKDELDNRLYTLLGYSQIQFGFYRDARESFRNVSINSSYANRALLGLGMAALHQEDFIGALNAFKRIRGKQDHDISVAESYLLSAFTLRQLGQHEAALESYQAAVVYYSTIDKTQTDLLSSIINRSATIPQPQQIFLRSESRDDKKLRNLEEKINLITDLQAQQLPNDRVAALTNTKISLEKSYLLAAQQLLTSEHEAIKSYLSQSKFGLATLYDGK